MRAANAALARVVGNADKRAWHLASTTIGPDEAVAAELSWSRALPRVTSAWAAAAATWERAADLSNDMPTAPPFAGRWHISVERADPFGAMTVLDEVVSMCDDPLVRSDAISIRSEGVAWMIDESRGVDELAAEAQRISGIDPSRAISIYVRASLHSGLAGRALDCQRHAQSAVEVAEPLGMPMLFIAQAVRAMAAQRLGDENGADTEFDSVALLGSLPIEMLDATLLPILQAVALTKLCQERWHEANEILDVSMVAARHHGLSSVLGLSGALQGEMFLRCGRLTDAVLSSVLDVDLNNTAACRPRRSVGDSRPGRSGARSYLFGSSTCGVRHRPRPSGRDEGPRSVSDCRRSDTSR